MATQVTNYQCPACTGPLHFETSIGKLQCEFCDSVFEVAEIEALYAKKDAKAAQAQEAAEAKKAEEASVLAASVKAATAQAQEFGLQCEGEWGAVGLSDDWGADAENMRAYNCPSCGAELICDATTAATSCPYCDNPTVIPGQFGGMLKPDFVVPFKLKKEDAIAALKKHYEGRPFLPKVFKDENHLQEIKGVYVPFWLFDGEASGYALYEGTTVTTYKTRDHRVTETSHYDVMREGSVTFSKIPVDASKKMDNDYMDSLEPFDYNEIKPFSTAYLPGFFADKYDESVEECGSRADQRAVATLTESLRDTVKGYSAVIDRGSNVSLRRGEVKYAMLPVWLLNTKWNGEMYQFAMNGQTGKFVGHLPVDEKMKKMVFAGVYGAAAIVLLLIMLFPGGLLQLLGM